MNQNKITQWVLRIAIAGEFIGHGVFALQGKPQWISWISQITGASNELATQLLYLIGLCDIIVAIIVIVWPVRVILLWAAIWGFWTALIRPIVGEPVWDFVERWANWGAPLSLLLIIGWPRDIKGWFK